MGGQRESICPICLQEMDLTDQELQPCICGYEICLWCWHFIIQKAKKDGNDARCPACCSPYDKEKILRRTINKERLAVVNADKKHTMQKTKQRLSDIGKDLYNIRVIRRNIVYISGIPKNLSHEKILMKKEYLGQYGKIIKIIFAQTDGSRQYYSSDSCIVYVTFSKEEEALRCIQVVNGYLLNGRLLRASFGTTRYCYSWLKNLPCKNQDCLYVHDVVPEEDICKREEVIPFCTSKLQQCLGLTFSNLKQQSGSFLPPPLETKNSLPSLGLIRNNRYMQGDYFGRSYASVAAADNQVKCPSMSGVPVMSSGRAQGCISTSVWDHGHISNEVSTPRNEIPLPKSVMEKFSSAESFVGTGHSKIACLSDYKSAIKTKLFPEDKICRGSSFPGEHMTERIVGETLFSDSDGYCQLSTCPANVASHASACSINSNANKWKCETGDSISVKISSGWDDLVSTSSNFNTLSSLQAIPVASTLTWQNVLPSYDRSRSGSDLGSEKFGCSFEDDGINSRGFFSFPTITKQLHHQHIKPSSVFPTGSVLSHDEQKNLCGRSSIYNGSDFEFLQTYKTGDEKLFNGSFIEQSEDSILSNLLALDLDAIDGPTHAHSVIELATSDYLRISSPSIPSTDDGSKSYFSMMDGLYGATRQLSPWSNSASDLNKNIPCPEIMEREESYRNSVNGFYLETTKNSEVLNGITLLSAIEPADSSRSSLDMHCSGYSLPRATQRTTLSTPPGFPPMKTNPGSTSRSPRHDSSSSSSFSSDDSKERISSPSPRPCLPHFSDRHESWEEEEEHSAASYTYF